VAERTGEPLPGTQAPSPASVRKDADERDKHSTDKISGTVTAEEPPLQARAPAFQSFAPIDILDYIYAVLHSQGYREKYKEFLKIDFPRVPYPRDAATFWQLVALGGELRQIHLLESPRVSQFITGFPVGGDNVVEKIAFVGTRASLPATEPAAGKGACVPTGSVFFNNTQYFEGRPRNGMELLHRRLPTRSKMAKRPQRPQA